WIALLVVAIRRRWAAVLPVALLPGLGILGYLYFTVSYPTSDGDVLKASYMLTTAPAWAVAFGTAFEWLGARGRFVRAALLVVPLTDLDQVTLAQPGDELGALVLLPDAEIVERLGDKYLAHVLFEELDIASPPTWLPNGVPDDARFPLLVKARRGFGSRHIYRAEDRAQLGFFLGYTPVDSIVQACLAGEEFSIDVFCDLEGR